MRHKRLNQSGFSAVEGLLIVIIVLLIGFIGYYVWHTQNQTSKTYNSATKVSQSTPPKVTVPVNYLTIKEWGVRAPYNGKLTLEYSFNSNAGNNIAYFSSTQLDATNPQCKNDYGGLITQYKSSDEYLVGDAGVDSGQTAAQYAATLSKSDYGHVGDYYYFYNHPQGACSDSQTSQDLQNQTNDAVKALLPKLQAVPQ